MATKLKRIIKNPLEHVGDMGDSTGIIKGVGDSLVKDLGIGSGKDFLSFLGMDTSSDKKGSHEPVNAESDGSIDIVNFKAQALENKAKKTESRIEAAIDYHRDILRSGEQLSKQEIQSMSSQVQQIKMELQSLVASSKMLQMEFAQITMEQPTANVGKYHTNFFEWVVNMIRDARKKVEDASSWINAAKGKGNKKSYWGMFKKHGTSFGLSNERAVSTQVG